MKCEYKNPIIEYKLLDDEEIKPISAYNGELKDIYYISNKGRIFSSYPNTKKTNGVMKQFICKGYMEINLTKKDGTTKNCRVNRLVLQTFKPLDDYTNLIIDHIDGNKSNNNLNNLRYLNNSENTRAAVDCGKIRKATDKEIDKVIELAKNGKSDKEIMDITNLSDNVIKSIRKKNGYYYGKYLKDVDPILNTGVGRPASINEDKAIEIYNIIKQSNGKISNNQLSIKYDVDRKTIDSIKFCKKHYSFLTEKYGLEPLPHLKGEKYETTKKNA